MWRRNDPWYVLYDKVAGTQFQNRLVFDSLYFIAIAQLPRDIGLQSKRWFRGQSPALRATNDAGHREKVRDTSTRRVLHYHYCESVESEQFKQYGRWRISGRAALSRRTIKQPSPTKTQNDRSPEWRTNTRTLLRTIKRSTATRRIVCVYIFYINIIIRPARRVSCTQQSLS